jgi:hypothetical protein
MAAKEIVGVIDVDNKAYVGSRPTYRPPSNWNQHRRIFNALTNKLDQVEPRSGLTYAELIVEKLVETATNNNHPGMLAAINMISERVEGKATQMIAVSGAENAKQMGTAERRAKIQAMLAEL